MAHPDESIHPTSEFKYVVGEGGGILNNREKVEIKTPGLTKREYFAGLALQGMLANPNPGDLYQSATWAVEAADALIKALNKETS